MNFCTSVFAAVLAVSVCFASTAKPERTDSRCRTELSDIAREELLDRPVTILELRPRLHRGLRIREIHTLRQLCSTPHGDLGVANYINDAGIREIQAELVKRGLSLSEDALLWLDEEKQETNEQLRALPPDELLTRSISVLRLAPRFRSGLRNQRIGTLRALCEAPKATLLNAPRIRVADLPEIQAALAALGLSLSEDALSTSSPPIEEPPSALLSLRREELLAKPVSVLELRTRIRNGLRYRNIETLGELCTRPYDTLVISAYINHRGIREIQAELQKLGLSLSEDALAHIEE